MPFKSFMHYPYQHGFYQAWAKAWEQEQTAHPVKDLNTLPPLPAKPKEGVYSRAFCMDEYVHRYLIYWRGQWRTCLVTMETFSDLKIWPSPELSLETLLKIFDHLEPAHRWELPLRLLPP